MLVVALAYYIAARLSLRFALIGHNITPLWPPTGIALVAFLRLGRRVWPAIAIAAFLVNLPISANALAAAATAVGNTAAPLVGAWLLERNGFHRSIDRIRDVVLLVALAALLSMGISATIGAGTLVLSGAIASDRFPAAWSVWWAGDAMGVLIFAPFLLWLSAPAEALPEGAARRIELAVLLVALAGVSVAVSVSPLQLFFLEVPLVAWLAWRFQQGGAAPGALIASCVATWAAVGARGAFDGQPLADKMLLLQAFNATIAFTAFFLAALVLERIRANRALQEAAEELGDRVRDRTSELVEAQELARIGRWEWNLATGTVTWSDEMFRIHGALPGAYEVSFEKAVELVAPQDRERIEENTRAAIEGAHPEIPDIEYGIVLPDGEVRILLGRGRIFSGDDGAPARMVGVVQDITERRAYDREHEIAETLQRALLPRSLPTVDGFAVAARYLPAETGLSAGGDWYDVVPLPDGSVSVVIGDVAGHGLEAASVMGQLRLAVRAYALEGRPPASVVALADGLLREVASDVMVTMLYLSIDAETLEARAVNAGHPPFLIVTPDGNRYADTASAPPLGLGRAARYDESVVPLIAGTTLILYTDGLIDRPDLPIAEGMRRLALVARSGNWSGNWSGNRSGNRSGSADESADLEALCDHLLEELAPGDLSDDVALLAVRSLPVTEHLHLRTPATPGELARIRRALARWLRAADVSAVDDVVLAVSEAAANAMKHAYGPGGGDVDIRGSLDGDAVLVVVRDFGRWREGHAGDGGRGLALMEACMTDVEIERGPEGTEVRMRWDPSRVESR
jgi:integral membrane sensor domain MASE1/anti-sigma regulatory factor (Ser/Thr protein kinase)